MKIRINNSASLRAFALILVMLVIIVLTVIVAGFAISMKTEMTLARNSDYDDELEWDGRSGMELARYQLANKCPEMRAIDALNQPWAGGHAPCSNEVETVPMEWDLGRGRIRLSSIEDMERKWDINLVAAAARPQRDVLMKALQEVGVSDEEKSSTIVDSILDWISPSSEPRFSGAKSDYYSTLNPPYACKDGNIDDLSELLLVKGVTPEIYWGSAATNHPESAYHQTGGQVKQTSARDLHFDHPDFYPMGLHDLFSPMGGKLNINTASVRALAMIPGIDEATAERIVQQRAGPDGQDGTEDDAPFQNPGQIMSGLGGLGGNFQNAPAAGVAAGGLAQYVDVRSYVFEVHVEAEINGYKRNFVGVVSRNANNFTQFNCVRFYWEN